VDPERLIFLDETATTTDMARRYGRSRLGERLVAAVPQGHWKTATFVAGLRQTRAASSRRWCSTGDRRRLPRLRRAVPGAGALEPGDVVVLDNLAAHKVDVGAKRSPRPAPPCSSCRPTAPISTRSSSCSPSSNALLRHIAARTKDELWEAIGRLHRASQRTRQLPPPLLL
jgi:hypothetical protein